MRVPFGNGAASAAVELVILVKVVAVATLVAAVALGILVGRMLTVEELDLLILVQTKRIQQVETQEMVQLFSYCYVIL